MGILVLFIGLTLRVGASFASVSLGDLTLKGNFKKVYDTDLSEKKISN